MDFCFEFFLPTATHEDGDVSLFIGSRQQRKDAEEEGDEEDEWTRMKKSPWNSLQG